jgi:dolichol-phosphate mannosyltransferase
MIRAFWSLVTIAQLVLGVRMVARLVRSAQGTRIARVTDHHTPGAITVLLPVLNEEDRLAPCLEGLLAQGPDVHEILVIDGGSTDRTRDLIHHAAARDPRVRVIDAAPVPDDVNGKAWNLKTGDAHADPGTAWILTIDADVRPAPDLASSLLAHAERTGLRAFSVATLQRLSGAAEGIVHPAMLATLVYRFGMPGTATDDPALVQANGQCFLVRRDALDAAGGFDRVLDSVCEDVTLARNLAATGYEVGFHESDGLVAVEMYAGWRDAWDNWSRSLPMRDHHVPAQTALGLAEILLLQALPPWRLPFLLRARGPGHPETAINVALAVTRLGMLAGMARAYDQRPWTYWLSPLADLPVTFRLWSMAYRRHHTWRGRSFATGGRR